MLSCGGGGKLFRAVYLVPTHMVIKVKIILLILLFFKLSECGNISVINTIQVKISTFLCRIVSYAKCRGRVQDVKCSLSCPLPPPTWVSK